MQQVVGDDVDLVALDVQPMYEVKIGCELVRSVERATARFRTKVYDRPAKAAKTDPASIGMKVVNALQPVLGDISIGGFVSGSYPAAVRAGETRRHRAIH